MEWFGVIFTINRYGAAVLPVLNSQFDAITRKILRNFQGYHVFLNFLNWNYNLKNFKRSKTNTFTFKNCKISFWKLKSKEMEFAKEIMVSQGSSLTVFFISKSGKRNNRCFGSTINDFIRDGTLSRWWPLRCR